MGASDDGGVKLERSVGLLGGIGLTMGTMIGSGIFASAPGVVQFSGSVGLSLIVWALSGLIALLGAISYCELCTMITKSGGEYQYLNEAFGPIPAFLFSWTAVIILRPAQAAAIGLTFASYLVKAITETCPDVDLAWAEKYFALAIILFVAFINVFSTKWGSYLQNICLAAKLFAIGFIVVIGLAELATGTTEHLSKGFEGSTTDPFTISLAFYNALWAYDCWNTAVYGAEEMKDPQKNLPRALLIGIPLVMVCYLLTNLAYFTVLTTTELTSSLAVAILLGQKTIPKWILWIIPVCVCFSTLGATNGTIFGAARLTLASAREGHLMKTLSYCDVKRKTPSVAIYFLTVLSCIYVLPADFSKLLNYFSFAAWLFYGLTVSGLIVMRFTQPDRERPIKVPLVIPVIFVLISAYLVVAPLIDTFQWEYIGALLFIMLGLVVYYLPVIYCQLSFDFMNPVIRLLQLVLGVAPVTDSSEEQTGEDDTSNDKQVQETNADEEKVTAPQSEA